MLNRVVRACSVLLAVIMLANMLPLNSFAEEYRESLARQGTKTGDGLREP